MRGTCPLEFELAQVYLYFLVCTNDFLCKVVFLFFFFYCKIGNVAALLRV